MTMHRIVPVLLAAIVCAPAVAAAQNAQVKRGEYIVTTGLCNDCHTPLVMGPNGPQPDMKRMLSGHPQDISIKAPANLADPWGPAASPTLTAWSGPWGVSFSANLTPDPENGRLRDYTEEQFVQMMRTGRHKGQGREILAPMPWAGVGKMDG